MMKDQIETSELNNQPQRNQDSINNFIPGQSKNEVTKEQDFEMSKWRSSSKLKGSIAYFLGGLYLLIAGIAFQVKYDELTEIRSDYYLNPDCATINKKCCFTITVDEFIQGPVYLFVEMKNYNQNTKTYFEKYNPSQIYDNINGEDSGDCKPFRTNQEVNPNGPYLNINGEALNPNDEAYPCGVRAYDHFTDKFTVRYKKLTDTYVVNTDKISWKYDREHIKNKSRSKQWIDLEDETIQVWMRPSGLSKFRKTVGRVDESFNAGDYEICSTNVYNHLAFDTTKTLILSNVNSTGGKNLTLVVCHLVGGATSILASIGLLIWHFKKRLPK